MTCSCIDLGLWDDKDSGGGEGWRDVGACEGVEGGLNGHYQFKGQQ